MLGIRWEFRRYCGCAYYAQNNIYAPTMLCYTAQTNLLLCSDEVCIYVHIVHPENSRSQSAFASWTFLRSNVFHILIKDTQTIANACSKAGCVCLMCVYFRMRENIRKCRKKDAYVHTKHSQSTARAAYKHNLTCTERVLLRHLRSL